MWKGSYDDQLEVMKNCMDTEVIENLLFGILNKRDQFDNSHFDWNFKTDFSIDTHQLKFGVGVNLQWHDFTVWVATNSMSWVWLV